MSVRPTEMTRSGRKASLPDVLRAGNAGGGLMNAIALIMFLFGLVAMLGFLCSKVPDKRKGGK